MAGRPAAVRGGGMTAVHYGLIAFVMITVLALAGFVFALTNLKQKEDEANRARRQLDTLGTPPAFYRDEAAARNSNVFAVMSDDLRTMAALVTGQPEAVGMAVKADATTLLGQLAETHRGVVDRNHALLTALGNLSRTLSETRRTSADLSTELARVQKENESLSQAVQRARDDYQAQVAALSERLAQLQADVEKTLADKDHQLADLQALATSSSEQTNQERVTWQRERKQTNLEAERLRNQINELQRQIQDLKPGSFDPEAILTKADGRIIRAIPGSDVVYMNLGEADRIKVGMGFEVYSQTGETRAGVRGKASLEVVTLMDNTSECRVTRTAPGQPIVEGDIVVNIAFERGRLPKFLVVGDFDLDYDGVVDFDGAERIKSIVRQWGGQVVDKLDETTDFVVIGAAPFAPAAATGERVSPQVADQVRTKELERTRFRDLITQARATYIPVITQNQFLYLTGYAGDYTQMVR